MCAVEREPLSEIALTMPRPASWSRARGKVSRTTTPSSVASEPKTITPMSWFSSMSELRSVTDVRSAVLCTFTVRESVS